MIMPCIQEIADLIINNQPIISLLLKLCIRFALKSIKPTPTKLPNTPEPTACTVRATNLGQGRCCRWCP